VILQRENAEMSVCLGLQLQLLLQMIYMYKSYNAVVGLALSAPFLFRLPTGLTVVQDLTADQ
jgi:hypothetical protein